VVFDFPVADLSAEDVERLRRTYEPLTQAVRELIDATIRTEVDAGVADAARAEIEAECHGATASSGRGIRSHRRW